MWIIIMYVNKFYKVLNENEKGLKTFGPLFELNLNTKSKVYVDMSKDPYFSS